MNEMMIMVFTALTVGAYLVSRWLFFRYGHPLFNMVLFGTILMISLLVISGTPYSAYEPAKEFMTFLLGPATVALAIPLYKNRELLRRHGLAIGGSVAAGSLTSMVLVVLLSKAGGLSQAVLISALPKSVTAPIAIEIAQLSGGDPALAVAFVVATGTFGGSLGPTLLRWCGIRLPEARGLALGTVAHAQGVGMALLEGEASAAMASSAMAIAAIFTSFAAPVLLALL